MTLSDHGERVCVYVELFSRRTRSRVTAESSEKVVKFVDLFIAR